MAMAAALIIKVTAICDSLREASTNLGLIRAAAELMQETVLDKSKLLLKSNLVYKKQPVLIHEGTLVNESMIQVQYVDETWKDGPADDTVLVGLRNYQDDKAGVILKYMYDESRLLKAYGELPENTRLNKGIAGGMDKDDEGVADDYIEFREDEIDKI